MCCLSTYVNTDVHHCCGQPPKRSFGIQAITAAAMLRDGTFGATTVTQVSVLCGVAPSYVKAAMILLASEDETVIRAVMDGWLHVLKAADMVKGRAYLLAALRHASPCDRIEAVRQFGVANAFDDIIVPALEDDDVPAFETSIPVITSQAAE